MTPTPIPTLSPISQIETMTPRQILGSTGVAETARPRRQHQTGYKRSKNGCQSCRGRKIKCDEKRPKCGHCKRLNHLCVYHSPPRNTNRTGNAGTSHRAVDRHQAAQAMDWLLARRTDDSSVGAVVRGYDIVGVINDDGVGGSGVGAASYISNTCGGFFQQPDAVSRFTPLNPHDVSNPYSYLDGRQFQTPGPLSDFEINANSAYPEQQLTYTAPAPAPIDGRFQQLSDTHSDTSILVIETGRILNWDEAGAVPGGFFTPQHLDYSLLMYEEENLSNNGSG
ncbi:hypothetical protein BDD12DRAFT_980757 [Trichophaea hybrida]|nr:hypothetical protein BDD12DRAFT_980757 [Trichophaea hybrida]